jgi:hypothetical protein
MNVGANPTFAGIRLCGQMAATAITYIAKKRHAYGSKSARVCYNHDRRISAPENAERGLLVGHAILPDENNYVGILIDVYGGREKRFLLPRFRSIWNLEGKGVQHQTFPFRQNLVSQEVGQQLSFTFVLHVLIRLFVYIVWSHSSIKSSIRPLTLAAR